jgi:hypothetical protein
MKDRITNILLLIIVILLGLYIYIALSERGLVEVKINAAVEKAVAAQMSTIPVPKDGYTPIKGKDYFDGLSATDKQVAEAVDSYFSNNPVRHGEDGKNVSQEQVDATVRAYLDTKPPQSGLTPIIQCNVEKNRWEIRYSLEDNWQLLNGKKVACTVE